MTYTPQPWPPEAYLNPYAAAAVTLPTLYRGVKCLWRMIRKGREVRMLEQIGVLPPDWDAVGRSCEYR